MNIENLTPEKSTLTKEGELKYTLDYGDIPRDSNRDLRIKATTEEKFIYFAISAGCGGCTKVSQEKITQKEYNATINYFKEGQFSRKVYINFREENGRLKKVDINLKGRVI